LGGDQLVRQEYVNDLSPSEVELIAEPQAVGDNASWSQCTEVRTATFKGGSSSIMRFKQKAILIIS
jgi:hypothetical protein